MSGLFDKTTGSLSKGLDMMLMRNNITASNIANAETPDYKAKKLDFEDELATALRRDGSRNMWATNEGHFPMAGINVETVQADIYDNPDINIANDLNTVDMEKEMATLTENSIRYRAATQMINKKLGALKYSITEGGN